MESHAEAAEGAEPLPAQASRMASLYQREALNQIQREALCVLCELCVSLFARGVSRRGRGGRRATPGAGLADGQPLSARSPQSDSARSPLRSLRSLRELFTARGNLTQRPRRAQSHSRQASRKASLYQRVALCVLCALCESFFFKFLRVSDPQPLSSPRDFITL